MKKNQKRKICFPVTNRVHYARQKSLLDLMQKDSKIDLQLIVGGSVLLDKYGEQFLPIMQKDKFAIHDVLFNVLDGGTHVAMAKTAGLTALDFANSLHKLNPDIVLIRGDRFEQFAVAMVSAYLNKTIAHIEGGDVSGTIDESVRHAITKLSHIHFVTNEESKRRVIQMGENPRNVHNVGSLDVEFASRIDKKIDSAFVNRIGTGHPLDFNKPFLMVMYHPVTTEEQNRVHVESVLRAIYGLDMQTLWFWPNNDAGTNEVAKTIRVWREKKLRDKKIKFVTDVSPENFTALLKSASCLIGNSSAGIKESSYFGLPVVNVGTRQNGRLRGPNVLDVGYSAGKIKEAILSQLNHGQYPRSMLYFQPDTSRRIVEILKQAPLKPQKIFYDIAS